jgi:hypothetical protein
MGKSDQYCRERGKVSGGSFLNLLKGGLAGRSAAASDAKKFDAAFPGHDSFAESDDGLHFVFVCRTVLGAFVQVGEKRDKQLGTGKPVFSAGTRELAMIPGLDTPAHYHSEIAEIAPGSAAGHDTHTEPGGNKLRFREMIVFRPTLVYPEYLLAYRHAKKN